MCVLWTDIAMFLFAVKACYLECPSDQVGNDDCTECEPVNGCKLAGQPCRNGGKCLHNPSALGSYTCMCRNEWAGKNCSGKYIHR